MLQPNRCRLPRSIRYLGLLLFAWSACLRPAFPSQLQRVFEKAFGKLTAQAMASQYGLVEDPTLLDWVQRIGDDVAATSSRKSIRYHFQILDTDEVNAFAAPDGYIFVTMGLLNSVSSDEELAAILGHEVAHVAQKHFTDLLLPELAILTGLSTIKDRRYRTATTASRLGTVLLLLRWSRRNEAEADDQGMWYAFKAGYDPAGIEQFLNRLAGSKPKSNFAMIFETHPTPVERLKRARAHPSLARDYSKLLAIGDSLAARSHLRAAAAHFRAAVELRPDELAPRLRLASVLERRGEFEEAAAQYKAALALAPDCQEAQRALALLSSRPTSPPAPVADRATCQRISEAVAVAEATLKAASDAVEADRHTLDKRLAALAGDRTANDVMQKTLVLRPKYEDIKWIHLLYEAQDLIVQSRRVYRRLRTVHRASGGVLSGFSSLHKQVSARAEGHLTEQQAEELVHLAEDLGYSAGVARSEVRRSVAEAVEAAAELGRGVRTLTPALFDLNSPFDTDRRLQYSRWAILEGAVARARHEIMRSTQRADRASTVVMTAGARCQRIKMNLLGILASPQEERIYLALLRQRLHCDVASIPLHPKATWRMGDAATVAVTARATGTPIEKLVADETADWTDRAVREGVDMKALRALLRIAAIEMQDERTPAARSPAGADVLPSGGSFVQVLPPIGSPPP